MGIVQYLLANTVKVKKTDNSNIVSSSSVERSSLTRAVAEQNIC